MTFLVVSVLSFLVTLVIFLAIAILVLRRRIRKMEEKAEGSVELLQSDGTPWYWSPKTIKTAMSSCIGFTVCADEAYALLEGRASTGKIVLIPP